MRLGESEGAKLGRVLVDGQKDQPGQPLGVQTKGPLTRMRVVGPRLVAHGPVIHEVEVEDPTEAVGQDAQDQGRHQKRASLRRHATLLREPSNLDRNIRPACWNATLCEAVFR